MSFTVVCYGALYNSGWKPVISEGFVCTNMVCILDRIPQDLYNRHTCLDSWSCKKYSLCLAAQPHQKSHLLLKIYVGLHHYTKQTKTNQLSSRKGCDLIKCMCCEFHCEVQLLFLYKWKWLFFQLYNEIFNLNMIVIISPQIRFFPQIVYTYI